MQAAAVWLCRGIDEQPPARTLILFAIFSQRRKGYAVKFHRPRLTYANVMSTLGVVLALGTGTAYAAVAYNSVGTHQIIDGQVRWTDIADAAYRTKTFGKKVTVAPGDPAFVVHYCGTYGHATGGGFTVPKGVVMVRSGPITNSYGSTRGWGVAFINQGSVSRTVTMSVTCIGEQQ